MKKIIFISIFLSLLTTNCLIVNKFEDLTGIMDMTGLPYDHETGKVASDRILEAAIIADLIASGGRSVFLGLISPQLAQIDKNEYYDSGEVDDCIDKIYSIGLLIGGLSAITCDLNEDKIILDYMQIETPL